MPPLTLLQKILASFRAASVTEREKGTYFEELICIYLRNEPTYADLYSDIWMLADVPAEFGISTNDTGIDLVARTRGTGDFHAIQCKFYAEDHRIQKSDIDSFFTASGQKPCTHRIIVTTTNEWTEHAEAALLSAIPITFDPIFSGLGWSLIFGLVASTLFTLFVIPTTYWLLKAKSSG